MVPQLDRKESDGPHIKILTSVNVALGPMESWLRIWLSIYLSPLSQSMAGLD